MALSIVTNVNSLVAQENLRVNSDFQSRTIQRLTSGYRINSSADDAAGLAAANKFRSAVTELTQGVRNANDGLSSLQIVDGGLNNIGKMLDRLKTLATQSASATLDSSTRGSLQTEYSNLLTEIDRQAANIGLGAGDTNANRFANNLKVYIGGGSAQANSTISVDLSTALVNSASLGISGTQVGGTTVAQDLVSANLSVGAYLDQGSSQTFRVGLSDGSNRSITVTGDSDGLSGNEIVSQINAGLAGTNVSVSLSATTGYLQISSSDSYMAAIDTKVGAGTQICAQLTDANAKTNTGKYTYSGALTGLGVANQTITVTPSGGSATAITLDFSTDTSTDLVFNKVKTTLAAAGVNIDVLRSGNQISLQSNSNFTISRSASAGSTGGIGIASGASGTVSTATAVTDPVGAAKNALLAIDNAVKSLNSVLGTVGTGQNKLQYAIQLAQSQITNYSAADSRIRDADVAAEAANLTKAQVLSQASMAAMAQANSAPQAVLSLLRG